MHIISDWDKRMYIIEQFLFRSVGTVMRALMIFASIILGMAFVGGVPDKFAVFSVNLIMVLITLPWILADFKDCLEISKEVPIGGWYEWPVLKEEKVLEVQLIPIMNNLRKNAENLFKKIKRRYIASK